VVTVAAMDRGALFRPKSGNVDWVSPLSRLLLTSRLLFLVQFVPIDLLMYSEQRTQRNGTPPFPLPFQGLIESVDYGLLLQVSPHSLPRLSRCQVPDRLLACAV
jgi:hypothetical protein